MRYAGPLLVSYQTAIMSVPLLASPICCGGEPTGPVVGVLAGTIGRSRRVEVRNAAVWMGLMSATSDNPRKRNVGWALTGEAMLTMPCAPKTAVPARRATTPSLNTSVISMVVGRKPRLDCDVSATAYVSPMNDM